MYQAIATDGYNQSFIVDSANDPLELLKRAKEFVHSENANNPLTEEYKNQNWEYYIIEMFDSQTNERIDNAVYSGKKLGEHVITILDDKTEIVPLEDADCTFKFYLGKNQDLPWYASHPNGKLVVDLNDGILRDKSVVYIVKVS